MIHTDSFKQFRVPGDHKIRLKDYDPGWVGGADDQALGKDAIKKHTKAMLDKHLEELAQAQELLYANDSVAVLIILQAMDAAGKDGTIKHVMSGLNPQGCQVYSFKKPSAEELDHDFLWRCVRCLPERGRIGIFNRSYYEEVLVVKVHPELLDHQQLPSGKRGKSFWSERYEDINTFERHLVRNGTVVLKFFLHVSKKEQKRRFLERLENPEKHWKFSPADLEERASWDNYMEAYEDALNATSTDWAPWYIIPADHKWVTRALVADILTSTIRGLDLRYPEVSEKQHQLLMQARERLNEK